MNEELYYEPGYDAYNCEPYGAEEDLLDIRSSSLYFNETPEYDPYKEF